MKTKQEQKARIADIIREQLEYVRDGQKERKEIERRLVDEAAPIPTERAASMVGRVNTNLLTQSVGDEVYDTLGLYMGSQIVEDVKENLPRIIANAFKQYNIENEFGDSFSESDFSELEDTMPEIGDLEQELASEIAIAISEFAMKVGKMALMLTGTDHPMVDED